MSKVYIKTVRFRKLKFIFSISVILFVLYFAFGGGRTLYYKWQYPVKYYESVKMATLGGFDDTLVFAIIKVESNFDTNAVSPRGAKGLMQLMPDTAKWCADTMRLDFEYVMFNPSHNTRIGVWYLTYLLDRYNGNLTNAVAAYNAGPGNVDRWLSSGNVDSGGSLVNIPFAETRQYVKKVMKAHKIYSEIIY